MSNTYITPTVVAKEALMQLKNSCVMGNLVYRGYESEWAKSHNGWKPGSSITIKAPVYARVQDGATINVVDIREEDTTMTLAYRKHVAFRLTSEEMTYSIDKFSDRIIKPAMVALGNYIDTKLLSTYKGICNQVGTPGTTPSNYLNFALAAARLTDHGVPTDNRNCVVNPTCMAYISDSLKGLNNSEMASSIVKNAYRGPLAGFNMYESQNVNNHTTGTAAGLTTVLMDATSSEGDTTLLIDTNGSWTLTVLEGDILTVAGTNACNPVSGNDLGYLRQFVVSNGTLETAIGTLHVDNGNDGTVMTIPGAAPWNIYSSAATKTYLPYQTVVTLPTNNQAVSVAGTASLTHPVNLAFHRDAIALAMVNLEMPPSVSWKSSMTEDGYTVRVIRDYDVINDYEYIRFDVLFGVKVLNPFMAVRIAG